MSKAKKRILFLCAHRSGRELLAASLLAVHALTEWDIWIAPGTFMVQDIALVRQVLDEIDVPLLTSFQLAEPSYEYSWDQGIILCGGATDQ